MTSELRPCPFCGGDNLAVMELLSRGFRIECEGCGAYSPVIKDGPALLTAWNRRAEQSAELAKFKALAETLAGALGAYAEYCDICHGRRSIIEEDSATGADLWRDCPDCGPATDALRKYKEARDA